MDEQFNLYLVTRTDVWGYDEYSEFLVCCKTGQEARETYPAYRCKYDKEKQVWVDIDIGYNKLYGDHHDKYSKGSWIYGKDIDKLTVEHIGISTKKYVETEVLLTSYHAG